jgi:hypothetical protein
VDHIDVNSMISCALVLILGSTLVDICFVSLYPTCRTHSSNLFTSTGEDGVLTVWNFVPPDDDWTDTYRLASSRVDDSHEDFRPRYDPVKKWGKGMILSACHDNLPIYAEETYRGSPCLDIVYRPRSAGFGVDRTLFAAPCRDGYDSSS